MKRLVVLLGPTGVGKTELSLTLAEHLHSPILSADSRQLYADLQIGTAAPTPQQLARVQHYFVKTLHLTDYYSAAQYEADVIHQMELLYKDHDTLLLTGGSMMYIDAVCKGIDDIPTVDEATRQTLMDDYQRLGLEALQQELLQRDPEHYQVVDLQNHKRVIHALEICRMTGKTYTSFRKSQVKQRPFQIIYVGLNRPREELFDRINARVDQMMAEGLLDEVKRVLPYRHENSLNTVGYKEMFTYLDGGFTLQEATDRMKKNTRVYAKKQLTWFKKNDKIRWFHPDEKEAIFEYIDHFES